jgi:hypothetical protein
MDYVHTKPYLKPYTYLSYIVEPDNGMIKTSIAAVLSLFANIFAQSASEHYEVSINDSNKKRA